MASFQLTQPPGEREPTIQHYNTSQTSQVQALFDNLHMEAISTQLYKLLPWIYNS